MTEERDPTLEVRQALRAIVDLSSTLRDQAVARASHHDLPGGLAMVALGPVSSIEAWENRRETQERIWWEADETGRDDFPPCDEDPSWEPPLQTLLFWSESWRDEHGVPLDSRPTVEDEAAWLLEVVGWAYQNEPHWADFERDIATAKARLEGVLYAGDRQEHGIPNCECGGQLDREAHGRWPCGCRFRPLAHASHYQRDRCCIQCWQDQRHSHHDQGGLRDEWVCRQCREHYDRDGYDRLIARDALDNATALTAEMLCKRFPLTVGQIRVWANRGHVKRRGRDEMGRMLYDVADVETRLDGTDLAG